MSSYNPTTRPASKAGNKEVTPTSDAKADVCDLLIDVDLEGVRLPRLARLNIGDTLKIERRTEGRYPTVVCVDDKGEVVGALSAFLNLTQLIKCLEAGVKYQVGISDLRPGGCRVVGSRVV